MRTVICPKCGAIYEQHPLNQTHQELCPACRNKASWENIRDELARASKFKLTGSGEMHLRAADARSAPEHRA